MERLRDILVLGERQAGPLDSGANVAKALGRTPPESYLEHMQFWGPGAFLDNFAIEPWCVNSLAQRLGVNVLPPMGSIWIFAISFDGSFFGWLPADMSSELEPPIVHIPHGASADDVEDRYAPNVAGLVNRWCATAAVPWFEPAGKWPSVEFRALFPGPSMKTAHETMVSEFADFSLILSQSVTTNGAQLRTAVEAAAGPHVVLVQSNNPDHTAAAFDSKVVVKSQHDLDENCVDEVRRRLEHLGWALEAKSLS